MPCLSLESFSVSNFMYTLSSLQPFKESLCADRRTLLREMLHRTDVQINAHSSLLIVKSLTVLNFNNFKL